MLDNNVNRYADDGSKETPYRYYPMLVKNSCNDIRNKNSGAENPHPFYVRSEGWRHCGGNVKQATKLAEKIVIIDIVGDMITNDAFLHIVRYQTNQQIH